MKSSHHSHIGNLKHQFAEGKISRRDFLRFSTLLGLSATAAYQFVEKVTGQTQLFPSAMAQNKRRGGIVRIAMRLPEIANPHTFSWVYDSNIYRQVGGYLTHTDHDNITHPSLLESWEASPDLQSWTLKLKPLKWHNGRSLVADDVIWNLKRVLDEATGSSVLGLMKGYMLSDNGGKLSLWDANAIEKVNDRTVRINTKVPQVAIPEHLFHYPLGILDPEEGGKFGEGSNGLGAFQLVEYRLGERAVFKPRRDSHWEEGPYLDQLEFVDLGDDPNALLAATSSGQIDGMYEANVGQLDIYRSIPGYTVHTTPTAQTGVFRTQANRRPFSDPRVRKALRLAVDPLEGLEVGYRGVGVAAEHHHVCPIHPDYKKLPFMSRNISEARRLLREAGFPRGINIGEITCKKDPEWELVTVQWIVEQFKEAGIRAKINVLPSAQFWDVWDKVPIGFTAWTHRPLGFMVLALAYRSGVPWNESRFSDREFDTLLTQAEGTLDIGERSEIIGKLEKIMQERGPVVQPFWRGLASAWKSDVVGFRHHPTSYIFGNQLAKG